MRACLEVNLKALKQNIKILSQIAGSGFFCPIVKANAYGMGALSVTQALWSMGLKQVGVVSIEEALELKSLGLDRDIYILGPLNKNQIPGIILHGFIPLIGEWESLKWLKEFSYIMGKPVSFHLKFNTGMNRFGFWAEEKEEIFKYLQKNPLLQAKGLASHLSYGESAGSQESGSAFQQIQIFKTIVDFFKSSSPQQKWDIHLLNSSGGVALWCHGHTQTLSLGFRPGISLYGIKPPVDFFSKEAFEKYSALPLKPVVCLKSFVVHSYSLLPGQKVSYGGEWKAKKKSTLAVVSMGYADGLPYRLYKQGEVLFRGERVPIAGRICMDFFMIDVTHQAQQKEIQKGEEVIIFGQRKKNFIAVEEQTKKVGSIPEEFLTCLSRRVQRCYKS